MQLQPQQWRQVSDDRSVATLPTGATLVLAGIGHPERFFATVRNMESRDFASQAFADHHRFTSADYTALSSYDVILMTEKDATKWHGKTAQACYYLPVQAQLPDTFWLQLQQVVRSSHHDA